MRIGQIVIGILLTAVGATAAAQRIIPGAERTELYRHLIAGKRVALVANQTSRIGDKHLADSLKDHIVVIFSPEHGFRGQEEAGKLLEAEGRDPVTGINIISLYGKNKKPKSEQLKGVDIVVFDLQDVGCRFYTYLSTLHNVMEACAEERLPLIVLDRPNPNAHYIDGPVLESAYRSFVGMHPVPVVYGMTIGEYAQMINGEGWLAGGERCELTVIPNGHYSHRSRYELPIAPSPNLPTAQAIALYPSLAFFEGTEVSVGRGTEHPFEVIGAPHFDADSAAQARYKMITFVPHSKANASLNPPHKDEECRGIDLSEETGEGKIDIRYLLTMYRCMPKATFFLKNNFFDLLAGTAELRRQIEAGEKEEEIRASWGSKIEAFKQIRKKYLIYED